MFAIGIIAKFSCANIIATKLINKLTATTILNQVSLKRKVGSINLTVIFLIFAANKLEYDGTYWFI